MSFANKYRPKIFDDVIGQDVTVQIIKKGILLNKLGHSFIFCGPRGIGKTTLARILAQTFNCSDLKSDGNPCCKCDSCASTIHEKNIDIIEIDAASNTGIDDMRNIMEIAKYSPTVCKYKTFIIDEVHMLSKSAFNSLLKALEEPPLHVKFIFATTELQKIPKTVISRCMRFELKRANKAIICEKLKAICVAENIVFENEAIDDIANNSDGSLRDALFILEHAAISGDVTSTFVKSILGLSNVDDITEILSFILNGNSIQAINKFKEMYLSGKDYNILLSELMRYIHKITCCKISGEDVDEPFALISLSRLNHMWQMMLKGAEELKFDICSIETVEMLILRMCYMKNFPMLEEVIGLLKKHNNTKLESSSDNNIIDDNIISAKDSFFKTNENVDIKNHKENECDGNDKKKNVCLDFDANTICKPGESHLESSDLSKQNEPRNHKNKNEEYSSMGDIAKLALSAREPLLHNFIVNEMKVIEFEFGKITFYSECALFNKDGMEKLYKFLLDKTGTKWELKKVDEKLEKGETLKEKDEKNRSAEMKKEENSYEAKYVKNYFNNATIENVFFSDGEYEQSTQEFDAANPKNTGRDEKYPGKNEGYQS